MIEIESSQIIIKKSKFICILFEIKNIEDIIEINKIVNKKYNKSAHICSGTLFEDESKFKNDGEVGQPGKILLQILKREKLNKHHFILIRYFGGVKLGMGGVARASRNVANEVIDKLKK